MMPIRLQVGFLTALSWAITTTVVCGFTHTPFAAHRSVAIPPVHGVKKSASTSRPWATSNEFIPPTPFDDDDTENSKEVSKKYIVNPSTLVALAAIPAFALPLPAEAAGDNAGFAIQSALVAYVHYASLLVCTAALMFERCTVDANISTEQEDNLAKVDAVYGIAALLILVSGVYRVTEYGKGWDFYSHETLFWLKISLTGVWGACSYFPTIIFIQRSLERRNAKPQEPISPALAARLKQVMNAELTALLSIPLAATFMSRGVLYSSDIPWQAGATIAFLVSAGVTYKYVNEALTWKEPEAGAGLVSNSE